MPRENPPTDDHSRLVAHGRERYGSQRAICPHCLSWKHAGSDCRRIIEPADAESRLERKSQNGAYHGSAVVRVVPPGLSGSDLGRLPDDAGRGLLVVGAVVRSVRSGSRYRVVAVNKTTVRIRALDTIRITRCSHLPLSKFTSRGFRRES